MTPGPDRQTLKRELTHWFNRNRSGEMSAEDTLAFQVWLDRDPAHAKAYSRFDRLWTDLNEAGESPLIMRSVERDERRFDRKERRREIGGFATSAVLAAVCVWTVASSGVLEEIGLFGGPPEQELRTSIGQRTTVTLRDKSVVTLDTDTVLRIRETSRERHIVLEKGRAFFKVAKDRSRPFIVVANGKAVQATGTAFDVRADLDRVQVTLIEGRVRVRELGKTDEHAQVADMRAGWRLDAAPGAAWRVQPVDVNKETSWHSGRLSFLDEPLVSAVAEMNRYSERKIVFDGAPPSTKVVGVFRVGDIDAFVMALELNKLARVAGRSDEHVVLADRKHN